MSNIAVLIDFTCYNIAKSIGIETPVRLNILKKKIKKIKKKDKSFLVRGYIMVADHHLCLVTVIRTAPVGVLRDHALPADFGTVI